MPYKHAWNLRCANLFNHFGHNRIKRTCTQLKRIKFIFVGKIIGSVLLKQFMERSAIQAGFFGVPYEIGSWRNLLFMLKNIMKIVQEDVCYFYTFLKTLQSIIHSEQLFSVRYRMLKMLIKGKK
jgi:hypothetical protein